LKDLPSWISNLRFSKTKSFLNIKDAKIHVFNSFSKFFKSGFWDSYQKVHARIKDALKRAPGHMRISIVGHSRGGAHASICKFNFF
jgi:hypothetical protein